MSKNVDQNIIIKRGLRVGDLEAETDKELLLKCFVDVGDIDILMDVSRPESIIVGRTGSGKSALILKVNQVAEKSVVLDPNDISIRFLEHSDVIQFFEELGVNLDLFYRYLWRHILTIELLKMRYSLKNQQDCDSMWQRFTSFIGRDNAKREALSYFREWGDKFWKETDSQLREVTEKLETQLKAAFGAELAEVDISLEGARNLSTESKTEIANRAKRVVSGIQIKKLTEVLELLEEQVFNDKQKRIFVLIDKLDEEWADSATRYKFIRALIEEIKAFRRISNIKIIVSMRRDLLDLVFDKTRDSGFQQEKYESYLLPLVWNKDSLKQLIELRINEIYKRQYTKEDVFFDDVFPSPRKHDKQTAVGFILERTLLRPRDAMQFVNECFVSAFGNPRVSWKAISAAESSYSEKRLKSLFEEWNDIYPALPETIEILRNIRIVFSRSMIADRLNSICEKLFEFPQDPCGEAVVKYLRGDCSESDVVAQIVNCFFRVGITGVKVSKNEPYLWSDFDNALLNPGSIRRINQIKVHKMLHRTLGIQDCDESGMM